MSIQDKFDEFCNFVDWESNTDWEHTKIGVVANYSYDEVKELERFAYSLKTRLESALNAYQRAMDVELNVSKSEDRNLLLSNVVAAGCESVQFFLDEPLHLEALYQNEEFEENFYLVFPTSKKEYEALVKVVA